ncbi:N-acetylglucosamine-6-phosphate deacetylase [Pedobacter yulinensis]|uniref:N-acetylglucosamine-6-phosphate deacetylase n=1 Tax=Pedobacter yulinensis TaxID=2126353 RepID=A0A2T3HS18_9SPHI|nr:N-acetylglucosamine-6-phosphate deacetylase [Pedobacter yulinensis]PST85219.1 N-acetylglucosamine-6-phosphate deacetylase [Pedobacter yulinensis]
MLTLTNCRFPEGPAGSTRNLVIRGSYIEALTDDVPVGTDVLDCRGALLCPGFIDLQIYGAGGNLFSARPSIESLLAIEDSLLRAGTTGFMICIATNSDEIVYRSLDVLKAHRSQARNCLGVHLEGPYLNPKKRGAHVEQFIRKATLDEVKKLVEYGEGLIRIMTIAPELQDEEVLDYLAAQDILLSLGHSDATFAQAMQAYDRGFATTTHLFNAMSPIQHRAPGIPVAAYLHPSARASIIVDGYHVDFEVIRMAKALMGKRLFLITDAVTACNEGPYQHHEKDGRFLMPDGTLSGSALTMPGAVKNCVDRCDIALDEAVRMAAEYPAELAGLQAGKLEAGMPANLVLLDESMAVQQVIFRGETIS